MSESIAWAVAFTVSVVTVSVATAWYYAEQDKTILAMVRSGALPHDARCAIEPSGNCPSVTVIRQ